MVGTRRAKERERKMGDFVLDDIRLRMDPLLSCVFHISYFKIRMQTEPTFSSGGRVAHLWRYAVKGLDRDELDGVFLHPGDGFPSDRRWAFKFTDEGDGAPPSFDSSAMSWVHKKHFLCAYTFSEILGGFKTTFSENDTLTVERRNDGQQLFCETLAHEDGRAAATVFFSRACGRELKLLEGGTGHHFGNTPAGFKSTGDSRVIHIVNSETIAALSTAAGVPLYAARFRPNVGFSFASPPPLASSPSNPLRLVVVPSYIYVYIYIYIYTYIHTHTHNIYCMKAP
jgi:hypothetical protein